MSRAGRRVAATWLGALLAMATAYELQKTATPVKWLRKPRCWMLARWTDEDATIVSCRFYLFGKLVFIVGSVCFFPTAVEYGGEPVAVGRDPFESF